MVLYVLNQLRLLFKIGNCDKHHLQAFRMILLFSHQKTLFSLYVWPVPASNNLIQPNLNP